MDALTCLGIMQNSLLWKIRDVFRGCCSHIYEEYIRVDNMRLSVYRVYKFMMSEKEEKIYRTFEITSYN